MKHLRPRSGGACSLRPERTERIRSAGLDREYGRGVTPNPFARLDAVRSSRTQAPRHSGAPALRCPGAHALSCACTEARLQEVSGWRGGSASVGGRCKRGRTLRAWEDAASVGKTRPSSANPAGAYRMRAAAESLREACAAGGVGAQRRGRHRVESTPGAAPEAAFEATLEATPEATIEATLKATHGI